MGITRPFAWLHIEADLPEEWEMRMYSLDPEFGELEFATREAVQARFRWTKKRIPRRLRKGPPPEWEAVEDETVGVGFTRLDPDSKTRFQWEFPGCDEATGRAVLASCRNQVGDTRRMTLYGIQAEFPAEFRPDTAQVHPANHMLSLEAPDHRRLVYRRWGLPDVVLQGETTDTFFRQLMKVEGLKAGEGDDTRLFGWPALRVRITCRGMTPLDRLRFRRGAGHGWIWLDEKAQRLCTLEQLGRPNADFPEPEDCFVRI